MTHTVQLAGWPKGMDNIHADHEIPADTLRRAINFDVFDSGKLRRRRGFSQALAASGAHSLWSDGADNAYFMAGGTLKRLSRDMSASSLGAVPSGVNPLAWSKVNADAYFTCPTARGKVTGGVLTDWGIDLPSSPPLMIQTAGALDVGTYHAVITYVMADGRESGSSAMSSHVLTASGNLAFYGLPIPTQAGVVGKRIYLTTADGEVFYRVAEVSAVSGTAILGAFGPELRTLYLTPPPRGTALAFALGRLFIADGKTVWFTESMDFDHVDPRKNFYQFPKDVTLIAGTRDGLYVCADQTYFIAGAGTAEAVQRVVFDFGAIAGTNTIMPVTKDPIWFSERGAVIGKDGGMATIVSEKLVSPGRMTVAASMVREKDSLRQFIVVGNNSEASSLQCGSYAEAEIVRRAK